jgi:signal transduction histidine kinase
MERVTTECPKENQPAVREMCKIVTESSRHMLALINDVLDFERLDTNQLKIENIPFDLHQEFTKLVRVLYHQSRVSTCPHLGVVCLCVLCRRVCRVVCATPDAGADSKTEADRADVSSGRG